MNYLLIVVALIMGWCIFKGYNKGFLRSIFYLCECLIIMAFVTIATPYVSNFIRHSTPIETKIQTKCDSYLHEKVSNYMTSPEEQKEKSLILPERLSNQLVGNPNFMDYLLEQGGIYTEVTAKLSALAVDGITYVCVFLIAIIVFRWVGVALKVIDRIPIVSGLNKWLGILAGAVEGFVIVWIGFTILSLSAGTILGRSLLVYVQQSPFLTWIYNNNIILDFALRIIH